MSLTAQASQVIQFGSANKTASGQLVIKFPTPFKKIPTVLVSSFWPDQENGVGYAETVVDVSLQSFTVASGNCAPTYYVNWIAIDQQS